MKKIVTLLLAVCLMLTCLTACGGSSSQNRLEKIQSAGKIVMATSPDFAPSEFQDLSSGEAEIVGCDIELGKYIAEKLGVELEIKSMDFDAVKTAVTTGTVDMAISGLASTPERAEAMELSIDYGADDPESLGHGIIIREEDADKYKTAEDFAGCTIAAQSGSLQQELATAQLPDDITLKPIGNLGEAVMMLSTGKIDAIASDYSSGTLYCESNEGLCMSEFHFVDDDNATVVAVPKGETELIEAINEIIEEVNEKGLYWQWKEEATELAHSLGIEVD